MTCGGDALSGAVTEIDFVLAIVPSGSLEVLASAETESGAWPEVGVTLSCTTGD